MLRIHYLQPKVEKNEEIPSGRMRLRKRKAPAAIDGKTEVKATNTSSSGKSKNWKKATMTMTMTRESIDCLLLYIGGKDLVMQKDNEGNQTALHVDFKLFQRYRVLVW